MQRSVDTPTSQGSTIILETDSLTAGLRADQSVGVERVCQKLEHKGFISTLHSFSFFTWKDRKSTFFIPELFICLYKAVQSLFHLPAEGVLSPKKYMTAQIPGWQLDPFYKLYGAMLELNIL